MAKINRLPKSIYELIAAGEVVERPASVVKELLENAIDAGATDITLEIQNGGIKYIRITDNGCGIDREDVPLAFMSHATSKIAREEDLYTIATLGFRGEALASISAVSRTEIITRTAEQEIGTRMVVAGGEKELLDDAGCPKGTTIIIRDLFYNTPARMKFLKTDRAEGSAVAGIVDKIALSHPAISIRFIKDGKQQLCTSGNGELLSAVFSVFGKDFSETLLPVQYSHNNVDVSGYVSKPYHSRGSGAMQMFFLNNRYIKSRTVAAALNEAYKNSVMVGKYPACVLFLHVMPDSVDVNVHPAKTEVRFSNERFIFDAVYYAVKNVLNADHSHPHISLKTPPRTVLAPPVQQAVQEHLLDLPVQQPPFRSNMGLDAAAESSENVPAVTLHDSAETIYTGAFQELPDLTEHIASKPPQAASDSENLSSVPSVEAENPKKAVQFRLLGEAFKAYILAEYEGKLIIIDKHAAHERMLYDRLKKSNADNGSQMLLAPVNVTLSKEEYTAVLENLEMLNSAGFDLEDFGNGSILARACPVNFEKEDLTAVITEIAGYLIKNKKDILPEKLDWVYHSIACRAAIKAGNHTSDYELLKFTEELLSSADVKYCPHGRPVMIEMTKYELDKQFGRV